MCIIIVFFLSLDFQFWLIDYNNNFNFDVMWVYFMIYFCIYIWSSSSSSYNQNWLIYWLRLESWMVYRNPKYNYDKLFPPTLDGAVMMCVFFYVVDHIIIIIIVISINKLVTITIRPPKILTFCRMKVKTTEYLIDWFELILTHNVVTKFIQFKINLLIPICFSFFSFCFPSFKFQPILIRRKKNDIIIINIHNDSNYMAIVLVITNNKYTLCQQYQPQRQCCWCKHA